jgi:ligand-binding sensor domain-containing protein
MRTIFLLLTSILFLQNINAQNTIGLPRIVNYDNANFHAGAQTWDIKQGQNGIIYFGNSEGLLTFDGNHWTLYPLPNKTVVRSVYVTDDKIYVGGQDELGFFSADKNGILRYQSLKNLIPRDENRFADVWNIEALDESIFFRATDRIFELKNNSVRVFLPDSEWRFLKKSGNRLIAQDKSRGLLEFRNNGWYTLCQKPFDDYLVSGILSIGTDSLLISTLKNGLFVLENESVSRLKTEADDALIKNQLYTLAKISDTEFIAGTTSDGCVIFNNHGKLIQKITRLEGLQNSNTLCLFLDNGNNIWAGLNNGISFISYNSAIKYIKPNKSNDLSAYSTIVYKNNLYIATSDGAYTTTLTFKNKDLSFSKGDFTQIRNSNGQVWRIDEVNQQLLMGYNDGIFSISNREAFPVMQGTGAWLFLPASSIFPSQIILSGTYNGIQVLNYNQGVFSNSGKIQGINESLRLMEMDNNNDIWASHPYRGIYHIKILSGGKKCTAQLLTDKNGLPSALGNYVFKIKNRIVFATEKGIFEYDATGEKFIPSDFLTPIFKTREIRYLHEDPEGNVWFCSDKEVGVVTFNKSSVGEPFTITNFPELTGEILTGSENIYSYNKDNIFIGGRKGVIHLNYEKYTAKKPKLNVLLTQVKAIGNKGDSTLSGGYYNQGTDSATSSRKDNIQLNSSFKSFHFEYSSPAYALQNNIEYSYKLQGYDQGWSPWTTRTEKDYTNLPTGKYIFNVKARDNLGHESETVAFGFTVNAPWFATIWAKIFYTIIIALLLYVYFKWQEKRLHLQQQKFDEEQRRLKELHQLKLEKSEKEIIKLQNEKLANEVKFKSRELADATLHLVERNNAIAKVKEELQVLVKKSVNNQDVKKTLQLVNAIDKNNNGWDQFAVHFNEVNNDFLKKLKNQFPILSRNDLKICAYLQLNLSSKEIARLMNISVRGVEISRYRLRKKLQIPTEQTMNDFLNQIHKAG